MSVKWTKIPGRSKSQNAYLRADGKVVVRGYARAYRAYRLIGSSEQVVCHDFGLSGNAMWWATAAEAKAAAEEF